jgi:hypothetical protein
MCTVLNSRRAFVLFFCREGAAFIPELRVSGVTVQLPMWLDLHIRAGFKAYMGIHIT